MISERPLDPASDRPAAHKLRGTECGFDRRANSIDGGERAMGPVIAVGPSTRHVRKYAVESDAGTAAHGPEP